MRRTQKEELLIVLDKEGDLTNFNKALVKAVGESAEISTLTPKTMIEIKDIDETATVDDITAAIERELETPAEQFRQSCRLHRGFARTQTATILLPTDTAVKLLKKDKGRIKIGWIYCKIREKQQLTRCFKCLDFGHISNNCKGPDRRNVCYKCGKEGHHIKDCKGSTQCIICKVKNLSCDHMLGSKMCSAYTAEINKKNNQP